MKYNYFYQYLLLQLSLLFCGCIFSVNPLYSDLNLVFDDSLVGVWGSSASSEYYSIIRTKNRYEIQVKECSNITVYVAYLVKIDNVLLMDIYPSFQDISYSLPLYLPMHTFIRVSTNAIKDELKIQFLGDYAIITLLNKNPQLIEHTRVVDDEAVPAARNRLILTANDKATSFL